MRQQAPSADPDVWVSGNALLLLENGEAFFPRLFDAIAQAQAEILIETFILFEDRVGLQLRALLVAAALRGVQVDVVVDAWGTPDLSEAFVDSLARSGARLHFFDPGPRPLGWRPKALRRMHRKIVVIDACLAFVGGINYSSDHLADHGPLAKQDYALQVRGPLVGVLRGFVLAGLPPRPRPGLPTPGVMGPMRARLVVRDNGQHRDDIERAYRQAVRGARERVTIANAYFFPGFGLVRDLGRAARRGVEVRLLLQGCPDMPIVRSAATLLYPRLLRAGVRIFEYLPRPFHGKVALVDRHWATVGSSNLDPLSLALNLEANVIVDDRPFNARLHDHLTALMARDCAEVDGRQAARVRGWRLLRRELALRMMRRWTAWAAYLPPHRPRLRSAVPTPAEPLP